MFPRHPVPPPGATVSPSRDVLWVCKQIWACSPTCFTHMLVYFTPGSAPLLFLLVLVQLVSWLVGPRKDISRSWSDLREEGSYLISSNPLKKQLLCLRPSQGTCHPENHDSAFLLSNLPTVPKVPRKTGPRCSAAIATGNSA